MKPHLSFTCLSLALGFLAMAGYSHIQPQNQVGGSAQVIVPCQEFPYSFDQAPFINPRIIQDLMTWISDREDQVVAINVLGTQDSNRYSVGSNDGEINILNEPGENPYIFRETRIDECGDARPARFGYRLIGRTSSGIYVLLTSDWGGGSGVFEYLLFVTFELDQSINCDWDKDIVSDGEPRLLIKKRGEIFLGDRWDGELKVAGNSIVVGQDTGWYANTPASPDAGKKRVLQINIAR